MTVCNKQRESIRVSSHQKDTGFYYLALVLLACAPTQWTFMVHGIQLHPAEPLLLVAGVWWMIGGIRQHEKFHIASTLWLVIGATALGVFAAGDHYQWEVLKEVAKLILYLVIAVVVFRTAFNSSTRWRLAIIILMVASSLAVSLGVFQWGRMRLAETPATAFHGTDYTEYASWTREARLSPRWVHSSFGYWISEKGRFDPSRMAFGGFLVLLAPIALGFLISERRYLSIICWMSLLFIGMAISVTAGYVVPALLLGVVSTGLAFRPLHKWWVLEGVGAYVVIVFLLGHVQISEVFIRPYQLTFPSQTSVNGSADLKRFWGEQQVALNLIRQFPVLGVGAGQYQSKTDQAWGFLGGIQAQWPEVDAYNGYLLTGASSGIVGLISLLILYGEYLRKALQIRHDIPAGPWSAALLGAMIALIFLTFVTTPFVRGTMLLIALLFARIDLQYTGLQRQKSGL